MYPISPRPVYREPFAFWEGFFSEAELDKINALPQWLDTYSARVGDGKEGAVIEDIRRSNITWLPISNESLWIYQRIANTFSEVNARYFNFELDGMYEDIQLGVYHEKYQGHYDWHTDGGGTETGLPARKLSMALLLSDPSEFEGGQLQLKTNNDEPKIPEQAKGRAWFFPAYTLHRVTPVTKGVRRSLVVWSGGKDFR